MFEKKLETLKNDPEVFSIKLETNEQIKVGIIGAAGYTGGELIRLLINHPQAKIVFAQSNSNANNLVCNVHADLFGETDFKICCYMPYFRRW